MKQKKSKAVKAEPVPCDDLAKNIRKLYASYMIAMYHFDKNEGSMQWDRFESLFDCVAEDVGMDIVGCSGWSAEYWKMVLSGVPSCDGKLMVCNTKELS